MTLKDMEEGLVPLAQKSFDLSYWLTNNHPGDSPNDEQIEEYVGKIKEKTECLNEINASVLIIIERWNQFIKMGEKH